MGLRDDQKELARRTVLSAVLELVAEGSLDELSVPAVARRSGVSLATIYRYFPTRDELLAAAAEEPSRQALTAAAARQPDDDDLSAFQRAMWTSFAANLELLRHQITSQAGRDMRQARLSRSREQLAAYVASRGVDAESAEGERLIALLLLVSGSLALVELHDRQGLAVDRALDASLWAVDVLIAASQPTVAGPSAAAPKPQGPKPQQPKPQQPKPNRPKRMTP